MQYREDTKSGNMLSVLGLGCMRFPRGIGGGINKEKAEEIIHAAIEQGINYFDTAYIYSGSEVITGEILEKLGARDKIYLATKLPHQKCETYEDFDLIFNEQLARLRTNRIDYYLIHNLSSKEQWDRVKALGIEKWITEKKAQGSIVQIGFSYHGTQGAFAGLLDDYDWDFCQIQYNYINEQYQAGRAGLQAAHKKGMAVMIMEPLLGGKLATGLPKEVERLFREADASRSPATWAFQWLWDQPETTVLLSGMNSVEQLMENAASASAAKSSMLSEKEHTVFAQAVAAFRSAYKVDCTGCNYCMPCPKGVNIPGCFAAYNARFVTGLVSGIALYMTSTGFLNPGKNSAASNCVACRACEKQCPQHILIAQEMKAVKKKMEPFWMRSVMGIARKFM